MPKHHNIDTRLIVNTLLLILTFLVLLNLFRTYELQSMMEEKIKLDMLVPPPSPIKLVVLRDLTCYDCFNVSSVVTQIARLDVNITSLDFIQFDGRQGAQLIKDYNLTFIPSVIIQDVPDNFRLKGFRFQDKSLILDESRPVYIELPSGRKRGMINITLIKPLDCPACFDLSGFIGELRKVASVRSVNTLTWPSAEAQRHISVYNLSRLPVVILNEDAQEYPNIIAQWKDLGSSESDGSLVFRNFGAFGNVKYQDVATGELRSAW